MSVSLYRLSSVIAFISVLTYFIFFYNDSKYKSEEVIVEMNYGELRGFTSLSRQGRVINSFRGIPYAKPPIGDLRFQSPVPSEKWDGVRDAIELAPNCLQADTMWKAISGQEDCLYLNVFTPTIPSKSSIRKLLPVMVFIHGGHFMFGGSALFGPQYFLDEDIVLVTLNYRVGAFGFLNAGGIARGNMGLKDQVLALKWVKSAIADFGGNPEQVTILGNSAGGASVHYHMISPLSRGLFRRAISQSGTALCPWAKARSTKDAESQARRLGDNLGCPESTIEDLFKCINSTDGVKIAQTQTECYDIFHDSNAIYGPSLEKSFDAQDTFLMERDYSSYESGRVVSKIPWLLGVNSEDGCYRSGAFATDDQHLEEVYKNWESLAPNILMYNKAANPGASKEILASYFGSVPSKFTTKDYPTLTNMFSDRYFFNCVAEAGRHHPKYAGDRYLYYFDYKGDMSVGEALEASQGKYPVTLELIVSMAKKFLYTKVLGWETHEFGACHADELRYLFTTIQLFDIPKGSLHYKFSKSLIKLWVSFAKNGRPDKFKGTEWLKVKEDEPPLYLHLNRISKGMIDEPFTSRIKYWENLVN